MRLFAEHCEIKVGKISVRPKAQVATADPDALFEKELSFTPAAAVEGRMNSLPADYAGSGWVVASVMLQADAQREVAIKGAIPILH